MPLQHRPDFVNLLKILDQLFAFVPTSSHYKMPKNILEISPKKSAVK